MWTLAVTWITLALGASGTAASGCVGARADPPRPRLVAAGVPAVPAFLLCEAPAKAAAKLSRV
jgi:hypothetical protein